MNTLAIRLSPAHGPAETFNVEGTRIRVGSAAYCEVRLPFADAAPEHVAIEDRGLSGLHVEALAFAPAPTLNGAEFTLAPLGPDDVLEIGSSQLRVSLLVAAATASGVEAKKKSSPLVYLAAIVAIPLALMQIYPGSGDEELSSRTTPPALFASSAASCSETDPASARAFAEQEIEVASAKRERRPFHAHDGVQGVSHFRAGAACYRLSADEARASEAEQHAAALERDLEESYRTHRVRLEHALSIKDYLVARSEVHALRDLTQGLSGEYVTWLSNLERRLKLRETKPQ